MSKKFWMGSIAIESAIIIPIILFCILGTVYLSFYLHDAVAVQAVINDIELNNYEITEADLKKMIEEQTIVIKDLNFVISLRNHKEKDIRITGENFKNTTIIRKPYSPDFIKKYKHLLDGIEKIKGKQ